jgi:hypothetical protein
MNKKLYCYLKLGSCPEGAAVSWKSFNSFEDLSVLSIPDYRLNNYSLNAL